MDRLVLYCKSYRNDLVNLIKLIDSINEYNLDNIKTYISVPKEDIHLFKGSISYNGRSQITILCDDDIYQTKRTSGWIQQQVIKSTFWKLNLARNYVCLDSDSFFIRPFTINDFMYDESTPYTVMHEQKELFSWSVSKIHILGFDPKEGFVNDRRRIMHDVFDRSGRIYDFGPSPVIWSSDVWRDLEEKYMQLHGLTFEDLIRYVPSEFSWYGEALLKFKSIPIYPAEPLFKVFHYKQQYMEYQQQNITTEMIAQNYLGMILQSNWNK